MNKFKPMYLIQGEVVFKVYVDVLVDEELYDDYEKLKEFMIDKALEVDFDNEEVDCLNEVDVLLTEKTANKYQNEFVNNDEWNLIIEESHKSQEELI